MYKECRRCGKEKPLTSEYFYRNNQSKDGFHAYCKQCKAKIHKKYLSNEENRQKNIKNTMAWQTGIGRENYLISKRKYDNSEKRTIWRRNKYGAKPRIFKNKENKFPNHPSG